MSNFLDTIVIFSRTFPMDTRDKKKLFKNFVRLVTETPVDAVVEKRIFNDEQAEDILYQNTTKNKVRQMLMIPLRRWPRDFSAFVEALRLEELEDLADRFNATDQRECSLDLRVLTYRLTNACNDPKVFPPSFGNIER